MLFTSRVALDLILAALSLAQPNPQTPPSSQPLGATPSVQELRAPVEKGDAQFRLGVLYDDGQTVPQQTVPQDDKEALKWYRLSADQDNADAQLNLGMMYGVLSAIKAG